MRRRVHAIAATAGLLTILVFWLSTVLTELFGSHKTVIAVRQAIPWGFILLIPALAITGATGFSMAGKSRNPRITAKKRRMPFIIGNGVLLLVPAAFSLNSLASHGEFGTLFTVIQLVELSAGATNIALMSLNMRDGLRLTHRLTASR
jgi:hypothetical protein